MTHSSEVTLGSIERLYRTRYREFLRVAEAICRDVEMARDAVQDGFAGVIRARFAYRGEASLETWVWAAVVNSARQQLRVRLRVNQANGASGVSSPGEDVPSAGAPVILALPERQRIVLFLRYYADLDYRAIAEVMGISTGTVGATLNQAHAALRRSIEGVS